MDNGEEATEQRLAVAPSFSNRAAGSFSINRPKAPKTTLYIFYFLFHLFSSALLLLSHKSSVHKGLLQQDGVEAKWSRTQWGDPNPPVLSHCVCLRYWRSAGLSHCGRAGLSLWQVRY